MESQDAVRRRTRANSRGNDHSDSLEGSQDTNLTTKAYQNSKSDSAVSTSVTTAAIFSPALITTLFLIFGGCCSNVYTLESILKLSPATGTLVTFLQFLLTSIFTSRSQFTTKLRSNDGSVSKSSFLPRLRDRIIPLRKWLMYTGFFLAINVLNNAAFNYKISIPLHIILRSAGPVTSMVVGYLVGGRRYTPRQIIAVILLFSGVVMAALSDAQSKSKPQSEVDNQGDGPETISEKTSTWSGMPGFSNQTPGFILLFAAQLLSAGLGLYTDHVYNAYGRTTEVTNENLFYSHTLSLPFFVFQSRSLRTQFNTMLSTSMTAKTSLLQESSLTAQFLRPIARLFPTTVLRNTLPELDISLPTLTPILLLLANALTQIICITGVNRLSTQTTSLTVSIVLNIRKLVSLLLSIWLFGNQLSGGVALGAVLVFLGGGLYGWRGRTKKEGTELKRSKQRKKEL